MPRDGLDIDCLLLSSTVLLVRNETCYFPFVIAIFRYHLHRLLHLLLQCSNDGLPLAYWGVAALWRRLKKRTGINGKRVSAHNARRYMATTQLVGGRSPLDVQRQMGHTTLHMTNKYSPFA